MIYKWYHISLGYPERFLSYIASLLQQSGNDWNLYKTDSYKNEWKFSFFFDIHDLAYSNVGWFGHSS